MAEQRELLTTGQVARMLQISQRTVIRLIDAGRLPSYRPGSHRYVRHDDVIAYRRRHEHRTDALATMVRDAEAAGLYDRDLTPREIRDLVNDRSLLEAAA